MAFANQPPQSRVPGAVIKTKEYALGKDLTKMSWRELLDLKYRQSVLLENKSRLSKLPDKGQKIQDLYDRVVEALEKKTDIDGASDLLNHMNLNSKNISNLEWEGTTLSSAQKKSPLDSDDDDDPIAILVSSNTVHKNQKIVKTDDDEQPSLITPQDIREAAELSKEVHLDPGATYTCTKENLEPPHRFCPNKPKPSTKDSKLPAKQRDNTAATPPSSSHTLKMLTLRESIDVENVHRHKMKELLEKQAAERLEAKIKLADLSIGPVAVNLNATMMSYRNVKEAEDGSDESEEEEVYE